MPHWINTAFQLHGKHKHKHKHISKARKEMR